MTDITHETVEHYAKLANLAFDPADAELLARQLGSILSHVEKIAELNLDDVPATRFVLPQEPAHREDEVRPSLGAEQALANAPDTESHHFLVPKVINVK
ncbi:Asp-tRNA(Asn)/Glu-tRNA(Gln) amidotransferase subunit GatC [Acanthopleuribacter pedis]|uniref:Aspartyl/glutamyl-tRNA(Asn/Gln) amidotransferase subunit C n=1 Tax=Acanthopleuribacter pedis TaxID=442870 RepID=A0A8J7U194_9BACT|nr:Asp-tRNA(Asn)/Glu-tRNA(Gln) amidotransferase subunit GatC [Acanthopleuribacter pedis]MBO1317928.1 Asp-tRNA(Asn)/Glu-tRNA(Gln) amidotransferase subunit GatC [Acanthopleuribacter pedis]